MKRRGRSRKPLAADFLASPSPLATPSNRSDPVSPKSFEFKPTTTPTTTTFNFASAFAAADNHRKSTLPSSPLPVLKTLSSISELKEMTSSGLDSIKRKVDLSHSDILKEVDSSHSRLHKRFKTQVQAWQQVMDQADKEYKKLSESIRESQETIEASYVEFIAEAQSSASRVCKTSIPDTAQSFQKAIDALRSHYGILPASI
ncbi:hypothetical protein Nepgr_010998 [Nepenthes gracilis]|uniref:Uncharacterized protein n=1 Tax=Nepenthes gracilis TaxID=150966 RepID=A0AAD3SDG6_NEPGR|nr:hypothetical protein Nepgr_010998 [Nepenthes gracilis]